jgi:hypothetical protein
LATLNDKPRGPSLIETPLSTQTSSLSKNFITFNVSVAKNSVTFVHQSTKLYATPWAASGGRTMTRSPTPSQRASLGYNTSSNRFDSRVMDTLESQNDDMIEGLFQKVGMLKNVLPLETPVE